MQKAQKLTAPILAFMLKTPEQGCWTTVFAATASNEELAETVNELIGGKTKQQNQQQFIEEQLGGQYFAHCRAVVPGPAARDDVAAGKLWEISEKLTGLKTASSLIQSSGGSVQ